MAELQRIALCADDYALTEGVSAGILQAATRGRLTAVSTLTTRPGWPDAARRIAPLRDRVEVGLHLNLTLGEPLSAARTLAPAGRFPAPPRLLAAALAGALPAAEIAAEIVAQLDAFETAMGHPPDFVDGHWHVHGLPGVRGPLLSALARRELGRRFWLRDSADRLGRIAARGLQAPKAALIAALSAGFGLAARQRGFATNDGFAGFSAFDPARDYGWDFGRFLMARGPRHLVMCHPGRVDADLAKLDDATVSRERVLDFLLSDAFAERLAGRGVRLARLGDL